MSGVGSFEDFLALDAQLDAVLEAELLQDQSDDQVEHHHIGEQPTQGEEKG
jgi:hypothetical protein